VKRFIIAGQKFTYEERADFLQAVLSEALEDLGLLRAVEEGLRTEPVDEDRIRTLLHPGR
jgi:hypothetical protein